MALWALKFLTLAAIAALIALMLYGGEPAQLWWWFFAIPLGAWIIGPSIAPYAWARYAKGKPEFSWVMLVVLALSSAWAASVYYESFFVSTSSTSALIMIFMPLYQWAFVAVAGLLSLGAIRMARKTK